MNLHKSSVKTALLLNNAAPPGGGGDSRRRGCVGAAGLFFNSNSSVYDLGGARPDTCEASEISSSTGKLCAVAWSCHLLLV